ncbi:hypothetical protein ACVWW4_004968 [Bradyrhizobium sp. LB7.1]
MSPCSMQFASKLLPGASRKQWSLNAGLSSVLTVAIACSASGNRETKPAERIVAIPITPTKASAIDKAGAALRR